MTTKEQTETIRECRTCLYMATHEKCGRCGTETDCLHTPEDWEDYRKTNRFPPFRYRFYEEGNWMDRIIQAEIDGTHNIVIGGQGEAEVNTKWTPEETSKSLHYVSEQCGYVTGSLHTHADHTTRLEIYTTEGQFELVWDGFQPIRIVDVNNPKGWHWSNQNPWRQQKIA